MNKNKGFTLAEIMIVMAIIGLLTANIAIPAFFQNARTAREKICANNRRIIEQAEQQYFLALGERSSSLNDLVSEGQLVSVPECPSGGVYGWTSSETDQPRQIMCSIHGGTISQDKLTSLGSNFSEISSEFISLMKEYNNENDTYTKGNWEKQLESLGLDPDEWQDGVQGIVYTVQKDNLVLKSDDGYIFYVTDNKGKDTKVSSVIYSVEEDSWYYDKVSSKREIDINTFRVEEK